MSIKRVDTIIVGGGVAGLACARKLFDNKKDFFLITENVGGRIITSNDGNINYGAYYVMRDYKHVKKYMKLGRKLTSSMIHFHEKHQTYNIFDKKLFTHFPQVIRLILLLRKFRKHYKVFKIKCERMSQKEALKQDSFLSRVYKKSAEELISEYKIDGIVDDYMTEVLHGTTFLPISKLNGFTFLQFALPLVMPIYEFKFLKEKIVDGFKGKLIIDSVIDITKIDSGYKVETKKKTYKARNVVVATQPSISARLLKLNRIKEPVNAHMFHIKGILKKTWIRCEVNLFPDKNRMFAIAHQQDNTYLFYSMGRKPKFKNYFTRYKIIKHIFWNPAFNLSGSQLLDSKIEKNLFLIGDHNICGMEDSYISGIYVANQIILNS